MTVPYSTHHQAISNLDTALIVNSANDLVKIDGGDPPTNDTIFNEGIQIRATSSSASALSLNCNDSNISNSTRMILRKIPTGSINDNTGTNTRDNEVLGYITGQGVVSGTDTVLSKITMKQDGTSGGELILAVKTDGGSLADAVTVSSGSMNVSGRKTVCGPNGTANSTTKAEMVSNSVLTVKPHDSNSTNLTFAQINNGSGIGLSTSNGNGTANWDTCIQPFGGKVGIGTDAPSDTLVVKNDSASVTPIIVMKNDNTTTDNGVSLDFSGKDSSDNHIIYGRITCKYTNHSTEKSELQFSHRNDSGALDQQLTLDHDGNFGIGTTAPSHKLTVNASQAAGQPVCWLHNSNNVTGADGTVISSVNDGSDAEVLHVRANNTSYSNGTSLMLVKGNGVLNLPNLPTSASGLASGDLWNNSGVINIV